MAKSAGAKRILQSSESEEIKIGYIYGWLQTSQNMVRIFVVLSLVVAIMIAPVFSGEYGGVDNIILTSRYGKTKCATAKIIGSILAALIVTTVVSIINYMPHSYHVNPVWA